MGNLIRELQRIYHRLDVIEEQHIGDLPPSPLTVSRHEENNENSFHQKILVMKRPDLTNLE